MPWEIVIAGGGFGGYYAARTLEKTLPRHSARVTLVNDVNFLLYAPLLPGALGGTLPPQHVVVPLRESLRSTHLLLGRVDGAEPGRNVLSVTPREGHTKELRYDQLIVTVGSISRALPIPGLVEHGRGFKTLPEAIAMRNRLVEELEIAETLESPEERAPHLTFVFVGAGYAGLEGLAELQDYAANIVDLYPRCRMQGTRWIMIEAAERVLPEISADLANFAVRELQRRGIEIRTGTTVEEVGDRRVQLSDGTEVATRNVVWTAGVRAHPVVERLGLPLERGRIKADRFLRVEGQENVWAIGDCAAVPDPARKGQPCPPTAQHAIRQGRVVAKNVAAVLGTGRMQPFNYKTLGVVVDMGRNQAVASTLGLKWRGLPAWFLTRGYHLAMMPGAKRKLRLMGDWTTDLLFGRVASELGGLGHPEPLGGSLGPTRADEPTHDLAGQPDGTGGEEPG